MIAKIKKSMKNCLLEIEAKLMLMRRSFIETIFSSLKSLNALIHTRHRSVTNAFAYLLVGLIHYQRGTYIPTCYDSDDLILSSYEIFFLCFEQSKHSRRSSSYVKLLDSSDRAGGLAFGIVNKAIVFTQERLPCRPIPQLS